MTLTLLERLRQIDRATAEAAEVLEDAATALGEYGRLVEHQARRIERFEVALHHIIKHCLHAPCEVNPDRIVKIAHWGLFGDAEPR